MERGGETPELRQTVFTALTGSTGDVGGGGDLRGQLLAAFGRGPRGGVNTAAAARALGVTRRTVERYVAPATAAQRIARPSPARLQEITRRARQAASTARGRRRALGGASGDSSSRYGAVVSMRGKMGPYSSDREYQRVRRANVELSAPDVVALRDAYAARGERGAVAWLEQYMDREYAAQWEFQSLDDMTLRPKAEE